MTQAAFANPMSPERLNSRFWPQSQPAYPRNPYAAPGGSAPGMPTPGAGGNGGLIQGSAPTGDRFDPELQTAADNLDGYKQQFGRTWMQKNAAGGVGATPTLNLNPQQGPTASGAPVATQVLAKPPGAGGVPQMPTGGLTMTNAQGQTFTANGPRSSEPAGGYGDQINAALANDPQYQKLLSAHAAAVSAHVNGLNGQQYAANAATVTGQQNTANAIGTDAANRQLAASGQNAVNLANSQQLIPSVANVNNADAGSRNAATQIANTNATIDQQTRGAMNQNAVGLGQAKVGAAEAGIAAAQQSTAESKYLLPFRGQALANMSTDPYVRDTKTGAVQTGTDKAPLMKPGWKLDDNNQPVRAAPGRAAARVTPGVAQTDDDAPYLWQPNSDKTPGGMAVNRQTGLQEQFVADPDGRYGLISKSTGAPLNVAASAHPPRAPYMPPAPARGLAGKSWDAAKGAVGDVLTSPSSLLLPIGGVGPLAVARNAWRGAASGWNGPAMPTPAAAARPAPRFVDGQTAKVNGQAMVRRNGQWQPMGLSDLVR